MTVSAAVPIDRFTGDGSTVAFSFSYNVFDLADVVVTLFDDSDPNVVKTGVRDGSASYDYTVTGSLSSTTNRYTGVTVTLNTAPPSGWLLALVRAQDIEQDTSLANGAPFSEKSLEFQLDKIVHMLQDASEGLARTVQVNAATQEVTSDVSFDNSATIKNIPDPQADRDVVPRSWVSGQLAGYATGTTQVVPSYAALTALDTATFTYVYVSGRLAANDGGEGWFAWDSTSTATDDDGTILASDAGGTGRWMRLYDGGLRNVKWYGAKGDGATDDSTAIQAAIDASEYGGIYFPPAHYITSTTITMNSLNDQSGVTAYRFRVHSEGCIVQSTLSDSDVTPSWAITDSKKVDVQGIRFAGQHVYICGLWFSTFKECLMGSLVIADRNNAFDSASFNSHYWNSWHKCDIANLVIDTGVNAGDVREFNSNTFYSCNVGGAGYDYALEIYGDQGPQALMFVNCDISDYDTSAIYVDEDVESRASVQFMGGYFDTAGSLAGTGAQSLNITLIGPVTAPNNAGFESRVLDVGSRVLVHNISGSQNGSRLPSSPVNLMKNGDIRDGNTGYTTSGAMSGALVAGSGLYGNLIRFTAASASDNFRWTSVPAPFTATYSFTMILLSSSTVGKRTVDIDGVDYQNGVVSFVAGEWSITSYSINLAQGEVFGVTLGTATETSFSMDVAYIGLTPGDMGVIAAECHPTARVRGGELTIATGVVTASQNVHHIDTQGDAASDDLDTITPSRTMDYEMLTILAANDARTVVVKHGTGNIRLNGGSDCSLAEDTASLTLVYEAVNSQWVEVARGTAT